jgi:hypothetical protein
MLTDEELFERLARVACPECLQMDYELCMRCDLGLEDCLYVAVCRRCRRQFDFENVPALDDLMQTLWNHAREAACPICGASELDARFICDTRRRQCYAEVRCRIGDFERRAEGISAATRPW